MLIGMSNFWIKIIDKKNNVVIDDFDFEQGINGPITNKHCIKCIASNQCWFAYAKDKRPDIMTLDIEDYIKNKRNKIGMYHYNCHCEEIDILKPKTSVIQLIIPEGKITWTFNNKSQWINMLGFKSNEEFLTSYKQKVIKKYCDGEYYIISHNKFGVAINIVIEFDGKGEYLGRTFLTRTGWIVFSNGKLKNNTLLGGREN